ncbi:MAG TPA: SGNH/GDSL hydrolase family protein [Enhygromyxa sp.]|nr:SGNH/GDSL hydrolase family protein [Enhygromyxa sp.]
MGSESGDTEASSETDDLPDLPSGDGDGDGDGDPGDGDPGDGDGDGDGDEDPYVAPLYPGDRVHSPITSFVRDNLQSIRALAPAAPADIFMKVGASSTVSQSTLYCFATDVVDLDIHEPTLGSSLDYFLAGQAGDTTPFDRDTLAAEVGRTAGWAITGAPSPVEQELAEIHLDGPSVALIHYGANDMHMGLTYASALPGYFANMSDLLDLLIDRGVVPVVFGISRRLDQDGADDWVQTYNAVVRGLAQARSVPFVDLRFALEGLPGYGLSGDGLHLESYDEGACILTAEGLTHGYNIRNLIALELLDRLHGALIEDTPVAGEDPPILLGEGHVDAPLEIPALPFADTRSTVDAPSLLLDEYSGCAALADESGPENIYRLVLDQPTPIRAVVLDRAGVDVDIHLLDDSASEIGCIARDDTTVERTLDPGTYYFSLDTYVNGEGVELSGEYTFVVLACEIGDTDCLL